MKSETPTIDTTSIDPLKLHEHTYIDRVTIDATSGNARCLMSKREFIEYINEIQKNIAKVSMTVDNDHKILVLGTEENMYPSIAVAIHCCQQYRILRKLQRCTQHLRYGRRTYRRSEGRRW